MADPPTAKCRNRYRVAVLFTCRRPGRAIGSLASGWTQELSGCAWCIELAALFACVLVGACNTPAARVRFDVSPEAESTAQADSRTLCCRDATPPRCGSAGSPRRCSHREPNAAVFAREDAPSALGVRTADPAGIAARGP